MGKNIAKKRPYGSGPHYVELFVGHSFGLRPTACQTALKQPDFRCKCHIREPSGGLDRFFEISIQIHIFFESHHTSDDSEATKDSVPGIEKLV